MPVRQGGGGLGGQFGNSVIWQERYAPPPVIPDKLCYSRAKPEVPAGFYAIVDNANTLVTHVGDGVHIVEKYTGVSGYNASAVSQVGIAGNFVLRMRGLTTTSSNYFGGGMNSDPLLDNDYSSVDRLLLNAPSLNRWDLFESGGLITAGVATNADFTWIWRIGTSLNYGHGATFAAAQATPDRTVTDSSTLYFDSVFTDVGDKLEVLLSDTIPPAIYNDTLSESVVAADIVSSLAVFENALAESGVSAFSPASAVTFPNALAESVTAADSIIGGLLLSATLSEALTAAFSPVVAATFNSALAEGVTGAAAQSSAAVFASSLAEVITAAAAQSIVATFPSALSEGVAAAAAQSVAAIFANALIEGVTASDSDAVVATFNNALAIGATASVVLVDQLTSGAIYNEMLAENVIASVAYAFAGEVKAFDGSDFPSHPARAWVGGRWAIKPMKYWDGAGWVLG